MFGRFRLERASKAKALREVKCLLSLFSVVTLEVGDERAFNRF